MKNKSLKWKLLFSYGVIFFFVIILGVTSISVMNMMSKKSYEYAEEIVPAVENVGLARRNMVSVRRYLLNAIIAETPSDYSRVSESMQKDREELYEALDKIEEAMPVYSDSVNEIRSKLQSVTNYNTQIMELSAKFGDKQASQQAYDIYLNKYAVAFDEAANMLIDLNNTIDNVVSEQENIVIKVRNIALFVFICIVIISFATIIIFTGLMLKYILVPVKKLVKAADALEKGDFSNAVIEYNSNDEFGKLSQKISDTMKRIVFITQDLEQGFKELAEGNLKASSKNEKVYQGEYSLLKEAIYNLINTMSDIIYEIRIASAQVSDDADQIAMGAQALSQGSTEQASNLQELSATLNDISSQVDENSSLISEVEKTVERAVFEVTTGSTKMEEMLDAMNDINEHSKEIEKIIKSIEDIAFQTNILALNAAVEAARAGVAGKGFAVVADEVRRLAGSTAEASKNTSQLILKSLESVQNGKKIADETADSLRKIADDIVELAIQANKASENSALQNTALNQITIGFDQIASVVQTNSATAQQSAAASQELSGQATILKQLTGKFKLPKEKVALGETENIKNDYVENSYMENNDTLEIDKY